jgi:hypothetical protein
MHVSATGTKRSIAADGSKRRCFFEVFRLSKSCCRRGPGACATRPRQGPARRRGSDAEGKRANSTFAQMRCADPRHGNDGQCGRTAGSVDHGHFSVSSDIGFWALFDVSVQTGVIMLEYINQLRGGGRSIEGSAMEGAVLRLRPIMMTMLVATLGLLPTAVSHAVGSDSQRPFAIVIVGGPDGEFSKEHLHFADPVCVVCTGERPDSQAGGRI